MVRHLLAGMVFVLISGGGYVRSGVNADVGGGGTDITSVSSVIHSAAEVELSFKEFTEIMKGYGEQIEKCNGISDPREKRACTSIAEEILGKARDIFARLIEQAKGVESEIAIHRKNLPERMLRRLDRLLAHVQEIRREANRMMAGRVGP